MGTSLEKEASLKFRYLKFVSFAISDGIGEPKR
jgi:hypothetical protein